ncbi:MAG TPA: FAD-binding oxidoreductase [Kofleriaceae bacterium]
MNAPAPVAIEDLRAALEAVVGQPHVKRTTRRGGDAQSAAWLVQPGSATEVAEIVALAGRAGAAVIPVGSGARAVARDAAPGSRPRLQVDSRRMSHVLHLDETSLVVHVQAGLTALALERILMPRGLTLGDFPPSTLGSTIGGLLAVRTPGKSSTRHGTIEDAVLGLSAVLADGRTVHTRVAPRRATGPDLARALLGSEGRLGFITAAVLRIHRRPEARFLAAFALPSLDDALAAVRLALREEAAPAALRVFDGADARAHLGDDVSTDEQAVLVVATAGPTDLAACDRDLVASAAAAMGGTALDDAVAERWWRRRTGQERDPQAPAPSLQVTAPPGREASIARAVRAAAERLDARARVHVSRFDADGAVEFFTFVEPGGEVAAGERSSAIRSAAAEAAEEAGAILLGSSPPGLEPYERELKRLLDPHGVFDPELDQEAS